VKGGNIDADVVWRKFWCILANQWWAAISRRTKI
jgi:hypothetical protein